MVDKTTGESTASESPADSDSASPRDNDWRDKRSKQPDDSDRDSFERWRLRQPYGKRFVLISLVAAILLSISFTRVDLHKGVADTGEAVGKGIEFLKQAFPVRVETARRVERLVQLGKMRAADAVPPDPADLEATERWHQMIDPHNLPVFSYIEDRPVNRHLPDSPIEPFYVERFGYLTKCLNLMIDTVEMAIWGTILSVFLAIPLGFFSARTYTPWRFTYTLGRAACSLVRVIPELIVALILVVMYGPGPVAGILALGFHTSGFLGKFFADDIENTPPGPQDALRSTGGNRIKVLLLAVLPQVMPQFVAYVQFILERNVRTATILGMVSAGGIGFELMARFDNGEYDAVATILILIFITVFTLEHVTQYLRGKLI
ncbi:MAG: phosphonate ABC transporter, permease protein PhnE [Proteobacteria bacterium]|nr:phosphonate ABC transporter, permease protein PhnE [Pseudomonadota bacterium]